MGTSVRNLKGKGCTVTKMYCFVQRRIFIVINFKTHRGDFAGHCPIDIYAHICVQHVESRGWGGGGGGLQ